MTMQVVIQVPFKEAKEADFGGFAFSVFAYNEPAEYAGGMDVKVGEIKYDDEILYDIVIGYPSDVQYRYRSFHQVRR